MAKLDLLAGMKVVDFSSYIAAPTCAKLLGEYGAEVIRIEPKISDSVRFVASQVYGCTDGTNPLYDVINGNKRQICLDTRSPEGKEVLHRLLSEADVFVSNLREAQAKRQGIDFETLHAKYPKLVYANVTGYGDKGISVGKPGFDATAYHNRSGLSLAALAAGSEPALPYPGLGDIPTGTYLALGVLAAYIKAQRTGEGDFVSVSLYGAGMWSAVSPIVFAQEPYNDKMPKSREGSLGLGRHYKAADDRWFIVNTGNWEKDWPPFAAEMGVDPALVAKTARHLDTLPHIPAMRPWFEELFASKPYAYWDELLTKLDIAHELCMDFKEIVNDPVAISAELLQEMHYDYTDATPRIVRSPAHFRLAGAPDTTPAHTVGEDTVEILKEYGYSDEEIAALKSNKVVGMAGDPDVYSRKWRSKFG